MTAENTLRIINFEKKYEKDFKELNTEWITKYFELEENDLKSLGNPEEYIIKNGGLIIFALLDEEVVGTCALIKINDKTYELAKMAVSPKAQGKQVGYYLGIDILNKARELGAEKVILLSNTKLIPAINLYKKLGFIEIDVGESKSMYKRVDIKMEIKL